MRLIFENKSKEELDKLLEVEKLLRDINVHFDTGFGCNQRVWEFDWSLRGVKVITEVIE